MRLYKRFSKIVFQNERLEHFSQEIEHIKVPANLKRLMTQKYDYLGVLDFDHYDWIYIKAALPDFFSQIDEQYQPEKRYMTASNNIKAFDLLGMYYSDASVRRRSAEIYSGDVLFGSDVYEFIQDLIMEEIIFKNNIYLEVLPTSNVLITSIGTYENHPFMRFNPPADITPNKFSLRTGKIKLLVGSDDPGIQGTNILMEMYHIKAIVSKKYGEEIAEKYVQKLIDNGNYIFNKK